MPPVAGTFQFPSVIPGFFLILFSKEVEEGRDDKEESNTFFFFFFLRNGTYMYMLVCVCILCIILS